MTSCYPPLKDAGSFQKEKKKKKDRYEHSDDEPAAEQLHGRSRMEIKMSSCGIQSRLSRKSMSRPNCGLNKAACIQKPRIKDLRINSRYSPRQQESALRFVSGRFTPVF